MTLRRKLQSYGMVTLITVLIWLYAEGQDVRSNQVIRLAATIPTQLGGDTVVDLADTDSNAISVELVVTGNASRVQTLRDRIAAVGRMELPLTLDDLPEGREGVLPIESLLTRMQFGEGGATLRDLGLTVEKITPSEVAVVVSRLVTVDAPVVFQPENIEIKPNRKIDPPQVQLMVPRSLMERLSASQDAIFVEAYIPEEDLERRPEGIEHTISAQLMLPSSLQRRHVKLLRQRVDVTFTIASKKQTLKLAKPVPVWLMAPWSELKLYDVTLDDEFRVLRDVTITGPRELIAKLNDQASGLRVVARLALDKDTLDRAINAGGSGEAPIGVIEVHQTNGGRTEVLEFVPLNPEALRPAPTTEAPPTFMSSTVSIETPSPMVHFTITRRSE